MSWAYRWVDTAEDLARLCDAGRALPRVAVDTEADSFFAYRTKVCLIQVYAGGQVWLIDALALGRAGLAPLGALFGDASVEKVMHGADYDLRVLDRDLGATVRGLADTQLAAQLGGSTVFGLAALLEAELGVRVDKSFQRANWGVRPLARELREYAAADVGHLFDLADRLVCRLEDLGRVAWWREECAALSEVAWEPQAPEPFAFLRVKQAGTLRGVARDRLAALWAWREGRAAAEDVPPFRILQPETLIRLASDPPCSIAELGETRGVGKSMVRAFGRELLALLASPPPAPERPRTAPPPRDRERDARIIALRSARDEVANELGLDGGLLAPRAVLETVADVRPRSEEALAECLGRRWRTEVLAPRLLSVVGTWGGG